VTSEVPDEVLAERVRAGDLNAFETLYQRGAANEQPDVVLHVNGPLEPRVIAVNGDLFIGRECAGVPESQRLILDDPAVSRLHLELRVDPASGRVQAVDHSRNGTMLNGAEMPTGAAIVLLDGDTLRVGVTTLMLRSEGSVPAVTPTAGPAPRTDVTSFARLPAITAVASSTAAVPDELVDRLIAAAALFGAIADRMPGSLVMVRWSGERAEAEKQCARYLDFAKLLAAQVPIEWSLLRA